MVRKIQCYGWAPDLRDRRDRRAAARGLALAVLLALLQGCAHFAIEDCGGKVLGENQPRIRSSRFRMLLDDPSAAANRFVPYAAMSTLAYVEAAGCGNADATKRTAEHAELESELVARGWQEVKDVTWVPPCADETGLFFRVWKLEGDAGKVVVAFRGTTGFKSWLYGNLHWFTRFLPVEDQYSLAKAAAKRVFDRFSAEPAKTPRFYTTGHSLGGGLAQHVLYSDPKRVAQAIAFDPTSVTGFADQTSADQASACECRADEPNGEPRIFRVYDAYEILSNLRIFHKTLLPPERHIQEVRFPNKRSHSMTSLALYLMNEAKAKPAMKYADPWYSGKGHFKPNQSCTAAFSEGQRTSCKLDASDKWNKCPQ